MSDERTVRVMGFEDAEKLRAWVAQVTEENARLQSALTAAAERQSSESRAYQSYIDATMKERDEAIIAQLAAEAQVAVLVEQLRAASEWIASTNRIDSGFPVQQIQHTLSTLPAQASSLMEEREKLAREFERDPYLEYQGYEVAAKIRALRSDSEHRRE